MATKDDLLTFYRFCYMSMEPYAMRISLVAILVLSLVRKYPMNETETFY